MVIRQDLCCPRWGGRLSARIAEILTWAGGPGDWMINLYKADIRLERGCGNGSTGQARL